MLSERVSPASLEANDVHVQLGQTSALAGVSVRVEAGACVALVGESGAGKTTLLRCFNRLVVPSAGNVLVDDVAVSARPVATLRRQMGYVPQDGGLIPHWRVLRNVALVPDLLGQRDSLAAATRSLQSVGLDPEEFGTRFPNELSGGQRQRVAVARAIAARPGVLLMDEPFGALDAVSRFELRALCRALREELMMTTLLVTHDLLEADYMADQIVVMRSGRVEQRGTFEELGQTPATPYVESLLARTLAGVRRTT